jgi:adenosylcobinamide-phosphate synthase
VADAFEVPLAFLMDPAHHRRHALEFAGARREWFSMPYTDARKERFIWGATAGMLRNFYRFLPPRLPPAPAIIAGMSFFAILFALLIEQVRPLGAHNPIHTGLRVWARWVSRNFDAGKPQHGWVAWILAVVVPALAALAVHWLLAAFVGWPAAMVWSVGGPVRHAGVSPVQHHFTEIRDALESGDEARARELLALWQRVDASELPPSEIVRHVIEYSVLAAAPPRLRRAGLFLHPGRLWTWDGRRVLYRMAEFVTRYWRYRNRTQAQPASVALQSAAARAWTVVDWLPARMTAIAFRRGGQLRGGDRLLAQLRAALPERQRRRDPGGHVRRGERAAGGEALKPVFAPNARRAFQAAGWAPSRPMGTEPRPGARPRVAHLRSIVGLVWRSVVLWMVLLALLTLARLLG